MPDPSDIMNQCEFIFAARQMGMGDLDLEEEVRVIITIIIK